MRLPDGPPSEIDLNSVLEQTSFADGLANQGHPSSQIPVCQQMLPKVVADLANQACFDRRQELSRQLCKDSKRLKQWHTGSQELLTGLGFKATGQQVGRVAREKLRVRSAMQDVLNKTLPESYNRIVFGETLERVYGKIFERAYAGSAWTA